MPPSGGHDSSLPQGQNRIFLVVDKDAHSEITSNTKADTALPTHSHVQKRRPHRGSQRKNRGCSVQIPRKPIGKVQQPQSRSSAKNRLHFTSIASSGKYVEKVIHLMSSAVQQYESIMMRPASYCGLLRLLRMAPKRSGYTSGYGVIQRKAK